MQILLGTGNKGKLRELTPIAERRGVRLQSIDSLFATHGDPPEVGEGGITYEENAVIKARGYARWAGQAVITDDTGIVFDALHGLPGVYTAGWGLVRVIESLGAAKQHRARFVTVVAYATPTGRVVVARGELDGVFVPPTLAEARALKHSLPFAPYFYPRGFAQPLEILTAEGAGGNEFLSHRGIALSRLISCIKS